MKIKIKYKEFRKDGLVIFYIEGKEYRLKVLNKGQLEYLDFYLPYDIMLYPNKISRLTQAITDYAKRHKYSIYIKKVNNKTWEELENFYRAHGFTADYKHYITYIPHGKGAA